MKEPESEMEPGCKTDVSAKNVLRYSFKSVNAVVGSVKEVEINHNSVRPSGLHNRGVKGFCSRPSGVSDDIPPPVKHVSRLIV